MKVEVQTRTAAIGHVASVYADLLKEGYKIEHVVSVYQRGDVPRLVIIGVKETETPEKESSGGS